MRAGEQAREEKGGRGGKKRKAASPPLVDLLREVISLGRFVDVHEKKREEGERKEKNRCGSSRAWLNSVIAAIADEDLMAVAGERRGKGASA